MIQGDVGDEADVERPFNVAQDAFGDIDILVNNAGLDGAGVEVADIDMDRFESAMRTAR